MPDKSKYDSLEQFFRKKTGEYDIQYDESDWLKLKNQLDIRDQQTVSRKKQFWMAAASALIIGILFYITLDNHLKINELNQLIDEYSVPGVIQDTTDEQADPVPELYRIPPVHQPEQAITGDEAETDPDSGLPGLAFVDPSTPDMYDSGLGTETTEAINEQPVTSGFVTAELIFPGKSPAQINLSCSVCSLERLADFYTSDRHHMRADIIQEREDIALFTPEYPADDTPSGIFPDEDSDMNTSGRFSLGLISGPDLSTAGSITNFTDPGYNLGLTVEYQFSSNMSISTGIVQSEVHYVAVGSEYIPSDNYFNQGIFPSETNATCNILDIPIRLNMSFLQFDNSRFFASAGLSSYIMLNEEYRFSYDYEQPGQVDSWNSRTGTNHLMSNATFSVGYELDILQNISLRAEPYVKLPIREVGWGNVKLFSMGSFLSVNYNL